MKITKERLKQIIKEEIENANQEVAPETKQEMANKFKELYTLFPKISGLDKTEIDLLNKLINASINLSKKGSAKTNLVKALKMLGVEINE